MVKFKGFIDGGNVVLSSEKPFVLRFGQTHETWPNHRMEFGTVEEMREFQAKDLDSYADLNQHLEFKGGQFVEVDI